MLTVGGLLLGTVLMAPGAASSAAPTEPAAVAVARSDAALGLRDPFALDLATHAAATGRRIPRPSDVHADLRNPFAEEGTPPAAATIAPAPSPTVGLAPSKASGSVADLHSPFDRRSTPSTGHPASDSGTPPESQPSKPSADLRDPFGR